VLELAGVIATEVRIADGFVGEVAPRRALNPVSAVGSDKPIPPEHYIAHLPKLPHCPWCEMGKMHKAPSRKVPHEPSSSSTDKAPVKEEPMPPLVEDEEEEDMKDDPDGLKPAGVKRMRRAPRKVESVHDTFPEAVHEDDLLSENNDDAIAVGENDVPGVKQEPKEEKVEPKADDETAQPKPDQNYLKQVSVDLVGPTTLSVEGHSGAAVARDKATRFPFGDSIEDKEPTTILEFWEREFPGHAKDGRSPHTVMCDNGGEFRAEFEKYVRTQWRLVL